VCALSLANYSFVGVYLGINNPIRDYHRVSGLNNCILNESGPDGVSCPNYARIFSCYALMNNYVPFRVKLGPFNRAVHLNITGGFYGKPVFNIPLNYNCSQKYYIACFKVYVSRHGIYRLHINFPSRKHHLPVNIGKYCNLILSDMYVLAQR